MEGFSEGGGVERERGVSDWEKGCSPAPPVLLGGLCEGGGSVGEGGGGGDILFR